VADLDNDEQYEFVVGADTNGDGQPEIALSAWDQCIYLLDKNGQPLWGQLGFLSSHSRGNNLN
jgi:sugar (pentulose or hexulose) kinase